MVPVRRRQRLVQGQLRRHDLAAPELPGRLQLQPAGPVLLPVPPVPAQELDRASSSCSRGCASHEGRRRAGWVQCSPDPACPPAPQKKMCWPGLPALGRPRFHLRAHSWCAGAHLPYVRAAAAVTLPGDAQCGGNQGSCTSACVDAAWPASACAAGYACVRQGADFWQCRRKAAAAPPPPPPGPPPGAPRLRSPAEHPPLPCAPWLHRPPSAHRHRTSPRAAALTASSAPPAAPAPAAAAVLQPFQQCGGLACMTTQHGACGDWPWKGAKCPAPHTCARHSPFYYQCLPPALPASSSRPPPAAAPARSSAPIRASNAGTPPCRTAWLNGAWATAPPPAQAGRRHVSQPARALHQEATSAWLRAVLSRCRAACRCWHPRRWGAVRRHPGRLHRLWRLRGRPIPRLQLRRWEGLHAPVRRLLGLL
jgi:hypothetical protein